jgi:O-antigen/teichoic acid export membrane protein
VINRFIPSRLKTSRLREDRNLIDLLRNSGLMYIFGILSIGLTLVQQVTTANLLGVSDYGRLAAVLSSGALILLLVDFRSWEAATHFLAYYWARDRYDEAARTTTWLLLLDVITGFIGTVLLILLAQPIARLLLQDESLYPLVQIYAISLMFRLVGSGIPPSLLRLYNRFDWLSFKSVGYAVARLVLMSGAAFLGFGLQGVLIGALLGEVVHTLLMLFLTYTAHRRQYPDIPMLQFARPTEVPQIIRLLRQLWIGATLKGLQMETFVPLLALLSSPAQVGLFRSGLDIATLTQKLVEPLTLVIQPQIAKLYETKNRAAFIRYLWQVVGLLSTFTVPFALVLLLAGQWIYPRLLGEGFADVAPISNWMVIGLSFPAIFAWLRPALMALDILRSQNWVGIVAFALSLVGLLTVVPVYGAIGAAVVMAMFHIIYVVMSFGVFYFGYKAEKSG